MVLTLDLPSGSQEREKEPLNHMVRSILPVSLLDNPTLLCQAFFSQCIPVHTALVWILSVFQHPRAKGSVHMEEGELFVG